MAEPCNCSKTCGTKHNMNARALELYLSLGRANNLLNKAFGGKRTISPVDHQNVIKLVAISEAESAGYTQACNVNANGTIDRGVWQINSVHGHGTSSYTFNVCADQAWEVFNTQGLSAWSTYGGARYLASLPAAALAAAYAQTKLGNAANSGVGIGATQAPTTASDSATPCVYRFKQSIPVLPDLNLCFDGVIGGLKMVAGGLGALIVGLVMLALVSRAAAPAAARAVRLVPAPVRAPIRSAQNRKTARIRRDSDRGQATERYETARTRREQTQRRAEKQAELDDSRVIAARARTRRTVNGPGPRTPGAGTRPQPRRRVHPDSGQPPPF